MGALSKFYFVIKNFIKDINEKNMWAYASSAAFFLFISLIPLLMLTSLILSYTSLDESLLLELIMNFIPAEFGESFARYLSSAQNISSGIMVYITIFTVIWAASYGMMGLLRGLNYIFEVEETRNYVVLRMQSCMYTLIMILVVVVCLFLMVYSETIAQVFLESLPIFAGISRYLSKSKLLLTPLILGSVFTLMYRYIPNRRCSILSQVPGGFIAGICWSVFSYFFSMYMNYSGGASLYRSLSKIIFILFWMYGGMMLLFFGAEFNKFFQPAFHVLHERRRERRLEKKNEMSQDKI